MLSEYFDDFKHYIINKYNIEVIGKTIVLDDDDDAFNKIERNLKKDYGNNFKIEKHPGFDVTEQIIVTLPIETTIDKFIRNNDINAKFFPDLNYLFIKIYGNSIVMDDINNVFNTIERALKNQNENNCKVRKENGKVILDLPYETTIDEFFSNNHFRASFKVSDMEHFIFKKEQERFKKEQERIISDNIIYKEKINANFKIYLFVVFSIILLYLFFSAI